MGQINSMYLLIFYCVLWILSVAFSFYLGKVKTGKPLITAIVTAFLSLVPLLGIIFVALLLLKDDIHGESV
jgi:hypothetical protein